MKKRRKTVRGRARARVASRSYVVKADRELVGPVVAAWRACTRSARVGRSRGVAQGVVVGLGRAS